MYFAKLFVPIQLASFIPYPPTGEPEPGYLKIMPLIALAIVALTALTIRKTRLVVFGVAFFTIMVSLTLQVLAVGGQIMAERYTYVPYIGLFFILGYGLYQLGEHARWKKYYKPAVYATVGIALLFAFMSFQRCKVWKDSRTLWSDVIEKHPKCGRAWLMRGVLLYDENDDTAALDHFNKAVQYRSTMAFCFYNRGLVLNRLKKYPEAIADFDIAIAKKSDYYEAFHHRGNAKYYQGKFDEALENYNKTLSLNPNFAKSYTNRGLVFYQKQQYQKAAQDLERSTQLETPSSLTYSNLGASYAALGQNQKALEAYSQAIQINPNDANAYGNRAVLYRTLGQIKEAQQDEAKVQALRR
jgi:tetratricopeptide (TPR) repeat protein